MKIFTAEKIKGLRKFLELTQEEFTFDVIIWIVISFAFAYYSIHILIALF